VAQGGRDGGEGGGRGRPPQVGSRWEWAAAALGALVVGGTIGFLAYEAATEENTPPDLVVRAGPVTRTSAGWLVEVRAENRGATTAAQVRVEGELEGDTGAVETSEVTIDYVPGDSERRAGLLFRRDPRRHRLEVRARGFDLP
jgi:uncharacterized protein (TIGR02588 family)